MNPQISRTALAAGSWLSKPWAKASARRLMIAIACLSLGATNAIAQEVVTGKRDQLSDRVISLAVENELLTSEAIDSHRIDAESVSGIVTLSGKIDNALARQRASELAQQVKGVMAVVNQIIVMSGERDDKDIAQDILQAWVAEDVTESRQLQVEVNRGTATVSGSVDSYAEKTLAEEIAAGVTGIENEVDVEYKTNRSDEEIREELQSLLESAVELDDADVKTKVTEGDVVLTGQVGSAFVKSTAERKAWVAGVKSVDVRGVQVDFDLYDGMRRRQRLQDVTDEKIVETVKLALRQDPRVLSYLDTIEVESDDGSVTLSGKVGRLRHQQRPAATKSETLMYISSRKAVSTFR